jgi:thiosulfate/3-mercaptopyruvate sulfurtransferase
MDDLVSTEWLAERLGEPGLHVLDASSHLPSVGRNAKAEFLAGHIPTAAFLNLEAWTDRDSPVPSALPNAMQFAVQTSALGIAPTDRVVIYDDSDVKTSARAWFIFRHFNFERVAILDGGMPKWRREGRPIDTGKATSVAPGLPSFPSELQGDVRSKADILANLESKREQLLDARGAGRFTGAEPEIRPGMPSGHIPGSRSLPFGQVLNADGTFKDKAGLRDAFAEAGIDLGKPVVTTCGSGVTAAVLLFAMHLIGKDDVALYDGSWSEWGADPATPKATGPAA